jgi:pimeloyl-ACP methyl ester carboxylesterase
MHISVYVTLMCMMVRTQDGAELCVEAIGERAGPAVLLLGGGWSMDWWDDGFCDRLACRGLFVVRYDFRDSGRSTTYPPGAPGYTYPDMVTDAIDAEPDWSDREAVIDHLVEVELPYAGPGNFDEPRMRAISARVIDRSHDVAATSNHFQLSGGDPTRPRLHELEGLPALILHGTHDPMFRIEHGRALAAEIPGARLIEPDGVGHELPPPRSWDQVSDALAALAR